MRNTNDFCLFPSNSPPIRDTFSCSKWFYKEFILLRACYRMTCVCVCANGIGVYVIETHKTVEKDRKRMMVLIKKSSLYKHPVEQNGKEMRINLLKRIKPDIYFSFLYLYLYLLCYMYPPSYDKKNINKMKRK